MVHILNRIEIGEIILTLISDVWNQVLERAKHEIKSQTFETWIKPIKPADLNNQQFKVEVPNRFFKDWIEEHYFDYLEKLIQDITSQPIELGVSIEQQLEEDKKPMVRNRIPRKEISIAPKNLNLKYTFENYVIGPNNRFCYAACVAISETPAQTYNPLFIYSGVGLGKTHLLHALGHAVLEKYPEKKVLYISCEQFTNQLIDAIQNRNTIKFRNRYRTVDVLLIDDIHFLSGKEQTQEEFFHTFNDLYDSKKQIVLSSDKPPKEIKNLEDRLVSRFEWGLVTDIQAPDYETRIAILRKKAAEAKIDLPDDVAEFLAQNIKTNIRKLEGALVKLASYASLSNKTIKLSLAEEILHDYVSHEKNISIELIQKKVAEHFDIRLADMISKKRPQAIAFPRQVAMYLSKEMTPLSLNDIGEGFGGRDHTTIMHGIEVVEKAIHKDFALKTAIATIKSRLQG